MYCSKCGAQYAQDAEFCTVCGAKLALPAPISQPSAGYCPQCGSKATIDGQVFCLRCGTRLSAPAAAAPQGGMQPVQPVQPVQPAQYVQYVPVAPQAAAPPFQPRGYVHSEKDSILRLIAAIANIVLVSIAGLIGLSMLAVSPLGFILLVSLAWRVPMTVYSWGIYSGRNPNTTTFAVLDLLFCSITSGILLCVSGKEG